MRRASVVAPHRERWPNVILRRISAGNGFWALKGYNGTHRDAYFLELGEAMVQAMKDGKVAETLNAFKLRAKAGAFL